MFKLVNKRLRNRKGFTLIELIVVIAILGILAVIAVPRLGGFVSTAEEKADDSNAKMLTNIAAIYQADNGAYPTALADIVGTDYYAEAALPDVQQDDMHFEYDNTTGIVTVVAD